MKRSLLMAVLALGLGTGTGCHEGRSHEEVVAEEATALTEEAERFSEEAEALAEEARSHAEEGATAAREAAKAMETLGQTLGNDTVQPVDFRKLRDLLPDAVAQMQRVHVTGEQSGALGIRVSEAEAEYDGVGQHLSAKVVDLGTLRNAAMMGLSWLDADIEREDERGYERTTRYQDYPAFEKYEQQNATHRFERVVVVAQRFVVTAEATGERLRREDFEAFWAALDLSDLVQLHEATR